MTWLGKKFELNVDRKLGSFSLAVVTMSWGQLEGYITVAIFPFSPRLEHPCQASWAPGRSISSPRGWGCGVEGRSTAGRRWGPTVTAVSLVLFTAYSRASPALWEKLGFGEWGLHFSKRK
jgi:hypothetical protein